MDVPPEARDCPCGQDARAPGRVSFTGVLAQQMGGGMTDKPEQRARRIIDANLEAAGWLVQSHDDLDLTAGSGIAVREFPMKPGFGTADYVLYVDRMAIGAIEAKPEGTLTGVEEQSGKYAVACPTICPRTTARCPSCSSRTVGARLSPTGSTRHRAAVTSSTSPGRRRWRSGRRCQSRCAPG